MGDFFISVTDLVDLLDSDTQYLLFDVRKAEAYAESGETMPGAVWRDHTQVDQWAGEIPPDIAVIVYCVHGHEVSQGAGTKLKELGHDVRVLEGGFEAWREAGGGVIPAAQEGVDK